MRGRLRNRRLFAVDAANGARSAEDVSNRKHTIQRAQNNLLEKSRELRRICFNIDADASCPFDAALRQSGTEKGFIYVLARSSHSTHSTAAHDYRLCIFGDSLLVIGSTHNRTRIASPTAHNK